MVSRERHGQSPPCPASTRAWDKVANYKVGTIEQSGCIRPDKIESPHTSHTLARHAEDGLP
eukprot:6483093-Amphidinium_carterae.1